MSGETGRDVERLWLAALEKLTGNVAHELRNALNGVAVNLEVVRSRSAREGVAASALGSYAASASEQLEQVIAMTDALMTLTRAADGPVAIGRVADRVTALVRPPIVAAGGTLDLVVEEDGTTRVPVLAARLFIAAALQRAVEAAGGDGAGKASPVMLAVSVRLGGAVVFGIEGKFRAPPRLDPAVGQLAMEQGVAVRATESSITLTFPA